MKKDEIPIYPMGLGCQLYRVTLPFDGFDKTNLDHFGYIHDHTKIKRRRLNKAGEPVLYTSSYPNIAERETLAVSQEFYLVKFRKTDDYEFKCFVAIDDNCSIDNKSYSRKAREAIKKFFTPGKLNHIDKLRQILEKDYSSYPANRKYKESSELASKIFGVADCILTYSKVDDGQNNVPSGQESNRFLNVTFNKLATDEHLRIETIYHCKPKGNQTSLRYEIIEIGVPNKEYSTIEWYNWTTEIDNINVIYGLVINSDTLINGLGEQKIELMPNVSKKIVDTHVDIVDLKSKGRYKVSFGIKLTKLNLKIADATNSNSLGD